MFERQAVAKALLLIGEITGSSHRLPVPEITTPPPVGISASAPMVPDDPLGDLQLLLHPGHARTALRARPEGLRELDSSVEGLSALSLPIRPSMQLISFQDPDKKPAPAPKPVEELSEAELKQVLKERMREYVFKMVNLYWKEHDLKTYGYWDQDGDGLADRLDQDSYNGHGVGKAYAKPIPGAREDGHYNCEYFAQNFWLAYRDLFYESNPKSQCWKLEYDGHATIAFYFEHKGESIYVFLEPQGGSSWFISLPQLPLNEMPARGSSKGVRGIMCHNLEENSWTGVERFPGSKPLPMTILDQLLDGKPMPGNRPLDGTRTPGNRPVKAEEANNPNNKRLRDGK